MGMPWVTHVQQLSGLLNDNLRWWELRLPTGEWRTIVDVDHAAGGVYTDVGPHAVRGFVYVDAEEVQVRPVPDYSATSSVSR